MVHSVMTSFQSCDLSPEDLVKMGPGVKSGLGRLIEHTLLLAHFISSGDRRNGAGGRAVVFLYQECFPANITSQAESQPFVPSWSLLSQL